MLAEAIGLFRAGKIAQAECVLADLLRRSPDDFDALHLRGIIARQSGRSDLAVELIRRAIRQNNTFPAAHRHLANALIDLGRTQEAVESFDAAIRLNPEFAEAFLGRGFALLELGRLGAALRDFDQALRQWPNSPELHVARASALRGLNRPAEALAACQRAIALRPEAAQAYIVQGAALADLNRSQAALVSFDRAIALQPDAVTAHNGRGSVLLDLQRAEDALVSFERALALQPKFANAHNNRGVALGQLMQFEEGLGCFERAIALEPDSQDYHLNAAHALLQLGRFETGWRLYEWRRRERAALAALSWPQPQWLGEAALADKTLLVQAEQGLGDTLQFSRYIRDVQALGATVLFAAPASLRRLLQGLTPGVQCIDETQIPPPFDYHCRLLSLPLALGTTLESIPAAVPYLRAEPARVAHWRQCIGEEGFRIGICWQGGTSRMDLGRSFPLAQLEPIAQIRGVRLISLQKGAGLEQLRTLPHGMAVEVPPAPFDEGPDAFVDTAALMECVDLVISSDTSIAHLAGALGRPVWIGLKQVPDWRWLLERCDSPWYPQLRLFRQARPGDWGGVFEAMRQALLVQLRR